MSDPIRPKGKVPDRHCTACGEKCPATLDMERRTVELLRRVLPQLPQRSSFPPSTKLEGVTRDDARALLAEWEARK